MTGAIDPEFYTRADAFINLANEQLATIGRGKVSASFMYAVARFNAWISTCGFETADQMRGAKAETIAYFVQQYQAMLEENLEDYINQFDTYIEQP